MLDLNFSTAVFAKKLRTAYRKTCASESSSFYRAKAFANYCKESKTRRELATLRSIAKG